MLKLRDYQTLMVDDAERCLLSDGVPCVVGPTGSGKTVMIAETVRRALERGEKALVTCHRGEILSQIMMSLYRHLGIIPQVITSGNTTPLANVTVAMIPTLVRRPRWIELMRGRTLLFDECHHCIAPSYSRLIERIQPSRWAGFTATPITPSGGGLGRAGFTNLVEGPQPRWLMDNGFLCDYRLYGGRNEIDTTGVHTRGGDFVVSELQERVVAVSGHILRDWRQYNPTGASTIAVGISVEHTHELCRVYRAAGISAAVVDGTTPKNSRDRIFSDFRKGHITVLCACAVVDEGLDVPEATCLQLLRPTRSLRLWKQLIGRVLRPAEEKEHAIIIDHGGSWRELPLPDEEIEWSLHDRARPVREPGEVTERDEFDVVQRRTRVVEDNAPLQLVNPRMAFAERAATARAKLHKMLGLVERGIVPREALRNHMRDAPYFSPEELAVLQQAANLPPNWAKNQAWFNSVAP
jgi:superfamily II DNA or RNA helicase